MRVAELFVRCLENEGVRYVFGIPGEETEDLLFALEASSIRFIPTRHEQGAAFMADVWGRLTGKAGVCLSTLGPGATNLLTGVADANLDKSPVVAITGQAGLGRLHKESHQHLDIVDMFRPVTKWNTAVTHADAVPEIVRKAFKIAEREKPGATHIELSDDMAAREVSGEPLPAIPVRRPGPDPEALARAMEAMARARRVLILAGNGAVRTRASGALRALVEQCDIPVVHTFMGQGAVSDRNSQSLLTMGLPFRDLVMDAVEAADLILAVGYDLAEYPPKAWRGGLTAPIVHVDFTPAEVDTHYQPVVEVVGDISSSLAALRSAPAEAGCAWQRGWAQPVRERILADLASYELEDGAAWTIPGALRVMREVMRDEDLLISDVGTHKLWIARNFPVYQPNGCLISNGLASMGIALPGGIAAALQDPARRIVAAMGDGGFLMNAQELETAVRLGAGFVIVVFNDGEYGQIAWKQWMGRGRATGTRIGNPDIAAFAKSFGIPAHRPSTVGEFRTVLERSLDSRTLTVVELPVDQRALYELSARMQEG